MPADRETHLVAVVRVDVREPIATGMLIELLEVGRESAADRLLGSATTIPDLCLLIQNWLQSYSRIGETRG